MQAASLETDGVVEIQSGGKLIGKGTYGCVFTPPLLCKGKTAKKGAVGKVTHKSDAIKEIYAANLLRKIPLAENYFVLPYPEPCELEDEKKQTDKDLKSCDPLNRKNPSHIPWKNTLQLFEPYGGNRPFFNLLDSTDLHPDRFRFYDFMTHILQAGGIMLLAGVCHFDLHPNNLLVDEKGVVRILDLGQAFAAGTIAKDTVDERWKFMMFGDEKEQVMPHPYIFNSEAPELTIANGLRNDVVMNHAIHRTIHGKPVFQDMARFLGVPLSESYYELANFFRSSNAALHNDWTHVFKLYWPGFDTWALASILLQVLRMQLSWRKFTTADWRQREGPTLDALRGMLQPNPMKRLDCIEALALFDPGNAWVKRFGQKWLEAKEKNRRVLLQRQKLNPLARL
jgi:hypothetical protein